MTVTVAATVLLIGVIAALAQLYVLGDRLRRQLRHAAVPVRSNHRGATRELSH